MATAFDLFAAGSAPKPLRAHQHSAIAMTKRAIVAGKDRIVVQMPTGAGKTRTAAEIVAGALAKGKRVAFTVPAISLVDQTVAAFEAEGIDAIGVMQANHIRTNRAMPVQVVSVQTLNRRQRPEADVVIVDECHVRFKQVSEWMADRDARRVFIGLSATPWAKGMGDDWNELVVPTRMQDLIDNGFLSPFRVYAPTSPDLSGVKVTAGDYQQDQLGEVMGGTQIVADVVQTWKARAQGLPTLVFAVNKAHAAQLVQQFADAGVQMGYCDDRVDLIERQLMFRQMARGDLAGIVNIGTLTTGVDADVRCVVLARPTKSEMLFVQMIGRGLRTAPGKAEALILDHADNHARMGFVTDIHHDRLLTGKDKPHPTKQDKGEVTPKPCPSCGTLKKGGVCPSCGFTPQRKSEVEVEAGELVEFKAKPPKHNRDEKQRFYSELLTVAKQRGRSQGWVANAFREKMKVWPKGLVDAPLPVSPEVASWVRAKDIRWAKSKTRIAR